MRNARNGDEAVTIWVEGGLDLVLMDVQMPDAAGLQGAQRIRTLEIEQGLAHTPIVEVTYHAMNGDREACLAAGIDGYTPKPVSP